MTLDEVIQEVGRIKSIARDDEAAHFAEDKLHVAVLREIANGHPAPMALAMFALQTCDIDFARWYA